MPSYVFHVNFLRDEKHRRRRNDRNDFLNITNGIRVSSTVNTARRHKYLLRRGQSGGKIRILGSSVGSNAADCRYRLDTRVSALETRGPRPAGSCRVNFQFYGRSL